MGDSWKFYLVLVGRFLSIDFLPNLILVLILRSEKQKKKIHSGNVSELWLHLFSYIQKLLKDNFCILKQFLSVKLVLCFLLFLYCADQIMYFAFSIRAIPHQIVQNFWT